MIFLNTGLSYKTPRKITLLVCLQVSLIICSFIVLDLLESEKIFLANAVNLAGKNRSYTLLLLDNIKNEYIGVEQSNSNESILVYYEKNIKLLKTGGSIDGIKLSPLSKKFIAEWDDIYKHFLNYEKLDGYVSNRAYVMLRNS